MNTKNKFRISLWITEIMLSVLFVMLMIGIINNGGLNMFNMELDFNTFTIANYSFDISEYTNTFTSSVNMIFNTILYISFWIFIIVLLVTSIILFISEAYWYNKNKLIIAYEKGETK